MLDGGVGRAVAGVWEWGSNMIVFVYFGYGGWIGVEWNGDGYTWEVDEEAKRGVIGNGNGGVYGGFWLFTCITIEYHFISPRASEYLMVLQAYELLGVVKTHRLL